MKDTLLDILYAHERAGCDGLLEWIAPACCPRCGAARKGERCGRVRGTAPRCEGAYRANGGRGTVLLVDATSSPPARPANACSDALLAAGAWEVRGAIVAR